MIALLATLKKTMQWPQRRLYRLAQWIY